MKTKSVTAEKKLTRRSPPKGAEGRSKGRNLVVIGGSMGGIEALKELVAVLPPRLPASILVVQHVSPLPHQRSARTCRATQ